MQPDAAVATRDRAILGVRISTGAAILGALGLTWMFGVLADAYFSGKPPAPPKVPNVPNLPAPVQTAPAVVVTVVHHNGPPPGYVAPRAPAAGPGAPPAAPPPPACHSTPSKPC